MNESIKRNGNGNGRGKPQKPYPDFPLFPHPNGQWAKKIKGKCYYFGQWSDWQAALEKYQRERDDLYAGRQPSNRSAGLTVANLCNKFLDAKMARVESGEMARRSWLDYKATCKRIIACLGRERLVESLGPGDFQALRDKLAEGRALTTLTVDVQRARSVFHHAVENELIPKRLRMSNLRPPSKKSMRIAKAKQGVKMFTAPELRILIDAADPALRAMILLGVNCGLGNHDIAGLDKGRIDWISKWITYPRQKTGVQRESPLWCETVAALREAIAARPEPKDDDDADLCFLTVRGKRWVRLDSNGVWQDRLTVEFQRLCKRCNLPRKKGRSFYALRHTFRTVADGLADTPAIDTIMGHSDSSMASHYRQRIDDDRLRAVTDHVHNWLWPPEASQDESEPPQHISQ